MAFQLTAQLALNPQILNYSNVQKQIRALSGLGNVNINLKLPTAQLNAFQHQLNQLKVNAITVGLNNVGKGAQNLGTSFMYATQKNNNFTESINHATKRLFAYSLAYRAVHAVLKDIGTAMEHIKNMQGVALEIGQTSNKGINSNYTQGIMNSVQSNAIKYGTSSSEIGKNVAILQSSSVEENTLKRLIPLYAQLSKVKQIGSMSDVNDIAIGLNTGWGQNASQIEMSFNKILNTSRKYGVETQNLVSSWKELGPLLKNYNGDLETSLALVATVRTLTRLPTGEAQNAIKMLIQNVYNKPESIQALRREGIATTDSNGKFKPFATLLPEIGNKANTMGDAERAMFLSKLSSSREVGDIMSLFTEEGQATFKASYTNAKMPHPI